jgi:hypothetical protein
MSWDHMVLNPASIVIICGSLVGKGLGLYAARQHSGRRLRLQVSYLAVTACAAFMIW